MRRNFVMLLVFIIAAGGFYAYKTGLFLKLTHSTDQVFNDSKLDAENIQAFIAEGKYDEADKLLNEIANATDYNEFGNYQLSAVISSIGVSKNYNSTFVQSLQNWAQARPTTVMPYLIRAQLYMNVAQSTLKPLGAEGVKIAQPTYFQYLQQAQLDLEYTAHFLKSPYISELIMRQASLVNASEEIKVKLYEQAIAEWPGSYVIQNERLTQLSPRWGGDWDKMYEFAKSNSVDPEGKKAMLLYEYHRHRVIDICYNRNNCQTLSERSKYYNNPEVEKEITWSIKESYKLFPRIIDSVSAHALKFVKAGDSEIAFRLLGMLNNAVGDNYAANIASARYSLINKDYAYAHEAYLKAIKLIKVSRIQSAASKRNLLGNTYSELAISFMVTKDFSSALKYLDIALNEDPLNKDIYLVKAAVNLAKGSYTHALQDYKATLTEEQKAQLPRRLDKSVLSRMIRSKMAARAGREETN